jgi:hypothetical protein
LDGAAEEVNPGHFKSSGLLSAYDQAGNNFPIWDGFSFSGQRPEILPPSPKDWEDLLHI